MQRNNITLIIIIYKLHLYCIYKYYNGYFIGVNIYFIKN